MPAQPAEGFLKTSRDRLPPVSKEQRTVLIRKGNELFNRGKVDEAKRIFLTVGYSDGLIRLGDYYTEKNDSLEAFRMYWLAPDRKRAEQLIEKMATIVRHWLGEERDSTSNE